MLSKLWFLEFELYTKCLCYSINIEVVWGSLFKPQTLVELILQSPTNILTSRQIKYIMILQYNIEIETIESKD